MSEVNMSSATIGAIAVGVFFALVVLMVLGWRFPHSLRGRLLVGVVIGIIAAAGFIYVSESVAIFAKNTGLSEVIADIRPQ